MMYEKTNKSGLYRDTNSGAIVNRDMTALEAYKKKKAAAQEMQELKNDVAEIKALLKSLLEKNNDK